MNHEASTSSSETPSSNILHSSLYDGSAEDSLPSPGHVRLLKVRAQQAKRAELLDNLIRDIDIMIYCQLSVLYYMDCSLFRFFLRALPQWFYFTPKPAFFPAPPTNRPYIGVILFTNLLVVAMHLLSMAPEASEATHGYLHGGLLIDFVGQLGPVAKSRLVGTDLLTMVLQFVIFFVLLEQRQLRAAIGGGGSGSGRTIAGMDPAALSSISNLEQDHDSEEQGVLRSDGVAAAMLPSSGIRGRRDDEDSDLMDVNGPLQAEHPLDTFNSGQYVIANLYIFDTLRTAWQAPYMILSNRASGATAATASSLINQR